MVDGGSQVGGGSLAASATAKAFCVARKLEMEIIIVIRNVAAAAAVAVVAVVA